MLTLQVSQDSSHVSLLCSSTTQEFKWITVHFIFLKPVKRHYQYNEGLVQRSPVSHSFSPHPLLYISAYIHTYIQVYILLIYFFGLWDPNAEKTLVGAFIAQWLIEESRSHRLKFSCDGHLQTVSTNCVTVGNLSNLSQFYFLVCNMVIIVILITRVVLGLI